MLALVRVWRVPSRGEATAMFFPNSRELHIIDFGCKDPGKDSLEAVNGFINFYRSYERLVDNIDLYITHFHYDHFSLLPYILGSLQSGKFRNIYIPGIPLEPESLRRYVLNFLALAIAFMQIRRIPKNEVLEKIAEKFKDKRLKPLYRGNQIPLGNNVKIRVVWPPCRIDEHVSLEMIRKLENDFRRLTEQLEKASIKIDEEEIEKNVKTLERTEKFREEGIPSEYSYYFLPLGARILQEMTRTDRELLSRIYDTLNDFSLILEYYYYDRPFIVIPGDNSNRVLDYVGKLEMSQNRVNLKREISFLRGAHHGTHYGGYLRLFKAHLTWLSAHGMYRYEYWKENYVVLTAKDYSEVELDISP